ncbi:MAG: alpha/beta fold hydrolase [Actinomycetota bacterium]
MIHRFDDVEIDDAALEIRRAGERVPVEPMVLQVILHLLRHAERVVPKTELLDEVWGGRFVSESALTSRIKSARQALGDDGRAQRIIRTTSGVGYRFVAELEVDADDVPAPAPTVDLVPEIRFVAGRGGVNLAAAATGAGSPLVRTATWLTHIDKDDLANPFWGHWIRELSTEHRLIRYDARGSGLSDRDLRGIALDDLDLWVDDLERVIDTFGHDRVALLGLSQGGPVAMGYAARHPDRVTHLVLFGTYARGMRRRDPVQAAQAALQVDLARVAWDAGTRTFRSLFARQFVPSADTAEIDWVCDQLEVTTDATNAPQLESAFHELDITDLAREITVPTLVLHADRDEAVPFEEGRRVAALIPGARFVPLESDSHLLPERDPAFAVFIDEVRRFLATAAPEGAG